MSEYAESIDVTTSAALRRLVEQVQKTRQPVPITRDSEIVAVLQPVPKARGRKATLPSEANVAISKSAFGGWKGLIDAEAFKRQIKEARGDHRPPVTLDL